MLIFKLDLKLNCVLIVIFDICLVHQNKNLMGAAVSLALSLARLQLDIEVV